MFLFIQTFFKINFLFDKLTLLVFYLDYIKNILKKVRDKTKMIFNKTKKIKIKYINVLKIE